jgi:hypothetical protein
MTLDPFSLLGLSIESSLQDARQAYRTLAVLAHPDKGGSADQMRTVASAYKFVQAQLQTAQSTRERNRSSETDPNLDWRAEFARYCDREGPAKVEPLGDDGAAEAALPDGFHEEFERRGAGRATMGSTIPGGYGAFMTTAREGSQSQPGGRGGQQLAAEVVPYKEPFPAVAHVGSLCHATDDPPELVDYSVVLPKARTTLSDYRMVHNETPEVLPVALFEEQQLRELPSVQVLSEARDRDYECWMQVHRPVCRCEI